MKKFLSVKILFIAFNLVCAGFAYAQNNPPPGLIATQSGTTISLSWTNIDETPNLSGYTIFARVDAGTYPTIAVAGANDHDLTDGSGRTQVTGESSNSFSSFSVAPGTKYEFIIYSYRGAALSPDSTYATLTTPALATAPGAYPGLFTFTALAGASSITLNFLKASKLPMNAHGYALLRRDSADPTLAGLNDGNAPAGTYFIQNVDDSTAASYIDNSVVVGTTYHYALVPYRVTFNTGVPVPETYNYGTISPIIPVATIPLTVDVVQLSGGIEANPLSSTDINVALLGFSMDANGASNLNTINIQVSSTPDLKLTNIRLLRTATATYSGSGTSVGTVDASSGTQIAVSAIGQNVNSIQYFFLVADVASAVTSATDSIQASFDQADITFSVGSASSVTVTGTKYGFIDQTLPTITTTTPADNATGVSVGIPQVTLTFSEPITSDLSMADANKMVRLKVVGGAFVDTLTLNNITGNVVTMNVGTTLVGGTNYAIQIGNVAFADTVDNKFVGISNEIAWNFQTEAIPTISSFSPSPICISDSVTVTGAGFGSIKPKVTVNGVDIPALNVRYMSSTQVRFQVPAGATTGKVRITNLQNGLQSVLSATNLEIKDAIALSIPVNPATATAIVGASVNISVNPTQLDTDGPYTYSYQLQRLLPASGNVGIAQIGNNGNRTFTSDVFSSATTYTYQILVSSANCTSKPLTNTVSVNVSSLSAKAGADQSICAGDSVRIGGSPTGSGGNGFIKTSWSSNIGGFSSLIPNPYVKPAATTQYYLVVEDSDEAVQAKDTVVITVSPQPIGQYLDSIKTSFTNQDSAFQLTNKVITSPPGGTLTFSGIGVSLNGNGKYYFDPKVSDINPDILLIMTYSIGGCTVKDTLHVSVTASDVIIGLDDVYCSNGGLSSNLTNNPNPIYNPSTYYTYPYEFYYRRLGFYVGAPYYQEVDPANINYPLVEVPATSPQAYQLNPQKIYAGWPSATEFYVQTVYDYYYNGSYNGELSWNSQFVKLAVAGDSPEITTIREGANVCADDPIIQLLTTESTYNTLEYTINTGVDGIDLVGSDYFFDPSEISFGSDSDKEIIITYSYEDNNNPACPASVTRTFNLVKKPAAPSVTDVQYCQFFEGSKTLTATSSISTQFNWYENSALTDTPVAGQSFISTISTDLSVVKNYYVTQIYKGCEGNAATATLTIVESPNVVLTIPPQCENIPVSFEGPNNSTITSWEWDFGDFNTGIGQSTSHTYPTPGTYTIKLKIKSEDAGQECVSTGEQILVVSNTPKALMSYKFLCEGDNTEFTGSGEGAAISQYRWDFGDGVIVGPGNFPTQIHTMTRGKYDVELVVTSTSGCQDTLTRTLTILPRENIFKMSNLDSGKWSVEDFGDSTSWEFKRTTAEKKLIDTKTDFAWVTNASGNYKNNDFSVVNSPCYNLTGFTRPVLSMEYMGEIDAGDGAVLEWSNNGVVWNTLGTIGSGLNWYNKAFTSFVGSSLVGWSGRDVDDVNDDLFTVVNSDTTFTKAVHSLSEITNLSNVRLRVVFKSDQSQINFEGFAFKNVEIKERNRLLLVEHFTNQTAPLYASNNTVFQAIPNGQDVVKLQYHLNFPQDDPINLTNPGDQNARASFYGITNTENNIPRTYLDGFSEGTITGAWYNTLKPLQSLVTSPLKLTVSTLPTTSTKLRVKVDIDLLSPLSETAKPVLYVVLAEKTAGDPNGNEFVVRKMLPSAAGEVLILAADTAVLIPSIILNDWSATPVFNDISNMAIIAFVQDLETKEVMQSTVLLNPMNLPNPDLITGTEDGEYAKFIQVYPNPASHEVNIELPAAVSKPTPVALYDTYGRVVFQSSFKAGEKTMKVSSSTFADGMYVMQLIAPQGTKVNRKIMVKH